MFPRGPLTWMSSCPQLPPGNSEGGSQGLQDMCRLVLDWYLGIWMWGEGLTSLTGESGFLCLVYTSNIVYAKNQFPSEGLEAWDILGRECLPAQPTIKALGSLSPSPS